MHTVNQSIPTGVIPAIPAKAHAHRALIAAAFASEPSTILLSRSSKDIDATMASLRTLGTEVIYENSLITVVPDKIFTNRGNERPTLTHGAIVPHESGTTLRLLLPVAAAICEHTEVDAQGRLPERPLEPLLGQLKAHGMSFSQDKPPFTMTGHLSGGTFEMVGNVSSQFFSGLLLAAPLLGGATISSTTPLQSRDYVRLTMEVMKDFGVNVNTVPAKTNNLFTTTTMIQPNTINPNSQLPTKGQQIPEQFIVGPMDSFHGRQQYAIEGDWSNAAIWLVAAALTGQPITVTGLNQNSVQADRRILNIITDSGATLTWSGPNVTCSGKASRPLQVDLEQMPDLLPVLASLACGIPGESAFMRGSRLRLKECDRLDAVSALVRDLGGIVRQEEDNIYITGTGRLAGGTVDCQNDHRLVMAGTLAALIADKPIRLKDSQAITKSYPQFFDDWNLLGGHAYVI